MNVAKVVVHEVQRHGMTVILDLLAKSVCQARKTAHPHAHRQVLALDVRSADVLGVRVADDRGCTASDARCGAVARFVQVVFGAGAAKVFEELQNRMLGNASQTTSDVDRNPFSQGSYHLSSLGGAQPVHGEHCITVCNTVKEIS